MPVTITKVHKEHVFDAGFNVKELPKDTHLFTAPYTMHFLDGAYLALSQCLKMEARINSKRDHNVTFIGPEPPTDIEEVIDYAFAVFRARNHYDLVVDGIYDYEGNGAFIQLVACISKLVTKIDKTFLSEGDRDDKIFKVLNKFRIMPESPKAIRQAVLHGGYDVVYMEPAEGKEILDRNEPDNTLLYVSFHYDFDVYFVRTNLHPSNFNKSLKPGRKRLDCLVKNHQQNFGIHMLEYWKTRINHDDCTELQKECDAGIQDYIDNEDGPTVYGFESQQGGLLMVVQKESFKNEDFLKILASKLAENCSGEVTQVRFDLFEPGPPTRLIDPNDPKRKNVGVGSSKVNRITFELKSTP